MHVYDQTLVIIGVCCIVAAAGGKGLEMANIRLPVLDRMWQQVTVGIVGVAVFVLGVIPPAQTTPTAMPTPSADATPTSPQTSDIPSAIIDTAIIDSVPPPAPPCAKKLVITTPVSGAKVSNGNDGTDVEITACGLQAGQSGWLFDHDTGDGTYNLDGNGGPIVTSNGRTVFHDVPIGNHGDVNKDTKITLVLADAQCTRALNQMDLQNADTGPTSIPSGCQIMSQIDVYVTRP